MRRSDREVTDFDEIIDIINRCDVIRIALNDGGIPYIVPLNFGVEVDGRDITFYFHSALEGKKLDLIRADGRAAFELDCAHALRSDKSRGYCTMDYESVMGTGVIEFVPDEQKPAALKRLVDKYHPEGFAFSPAAVPRTAVLKLSVRSVTAKRRKAK